MEPPAIVFVATVNHTIKLQLLDSDVHLAQNINIFLIVKAQLQSNEREKWSESVL